VLLSLVDVFRCPAAHEETALVLSVDAWNGIRVDRGILGCPLCHSRYPIVNSVVDFRSSRSPDKGSSVIEQTSPGNPMRLRAQLDLTEPGGVLLLTGRYARQAPQLQAQVDVTCLLVDSPAWDEHSVELRLDDRVPMASGSLRAAAVDQSTGLPALLVEVGRALRPGGRLVAPAGSETPQSVRVVARDGLEWVGELEPLPSIVPLRRSSPR
jgi:uncharacterized protein YbaR (Trm112 family)